MGECLFFELNLDLDRSKKLKKNKNRGFRPYFCDFLALLVLNKGLKRSLVRSGHSGVA